jgi:hypothetical protein
MRILRQSPPPNRSPPPFSPPSYYRKRKVVERRGACCLRQNIQPGSAHTPQEPFSHALLGQRARRRLHPGALAQAAGRGSCVPPLSAPWPPLNPPRPYTQGSTAAPPPRQHKGASPRPPCIFAGHRLEKICRSQAGARKVLKRTYAEFDTGT